MYDSFMTQKSASNERNADGICCSWCAWLALLSLETCKTPNHCKYGRLDHTSNFTITCLRIGFNQAKQRDKQVRHSDLKVTKLDVRFLSVDPLRPSNAGKIWSSSEHCYQVVVLVLG